MHRPLPWPGCSGTSPGRALPNREHPTLPESSQVQVRTTPQHNHQPRTRIYSHGCSPMASAQPSEVHQCGHRDTTSATLGRQTTRTVPYAVGALPVAIVGRLCAVDTLPQVALGRGLTRVDVYLRHIMCVPFPLGTFLAVAPLRLAARECCAQTTRVGCVPLPLAALRSRSKNQGGCA